MPPRQFWQSWFWTKEGDFDIGWILVVLLTLAGVTGFLVELITGKRASLASWSFVGSALSASLIVSVPIARARILASSKLPGMVASGISSARAEEMSTDVQELRAQGVTVPADDRG